MSRRRGTPGIRILDVGLVLLLSGVVGLVLLQVFTRYALRVSISGIEELARLLFVWACFLGIGLASLQGEQIAVELLRDRLSPRARRIVSLVNSILTVGVALVMVIVGTSFVVRKWMFPDYSTVLLYPRVLFWAPVPIAGAIILAAEALRVVKLLRKRAPGEEA